MTRAQRMQVVADHITTMIHTFTASADVTVSYENITAAEIAKMDEWTRMEHHFLPDEEYFLVYLGKKLLYTVNVSCDAPLTAASELMDLVARKF